MNLRGKGDKGGKEIYRPETPQKVTRWRLGMELFIFNICADNKKKCR